jgi:hypothetical protein
MVNRKGFADLLFHEAIDLELKNATQFARKSKGNRHNQQTQSYWKEWSCLKVGGHPRLSAVTAAIAHPWDVYGQMIEHLRMNGIDPEKS